MSHRDDRSPLPDSATTAPEYVAALRDLREWSALTYRQLAAKAEASGRVLPASTVAAALSRNTLPRPELVEALVYACGLDGNTATRWLEIRNDIAAGRVVARATGADPHPTEASGTDTAFAGGTGPPKPPPWWRRRQGAVLPAVCAAVLAAALIPLGFRYFDDNNDGDNGDTRSTAFTRPPDGRYLLVPTHIADRSLCLGESRERNGRTDRPLAGQLPCEGIVPDTHLISVAPDVYRIEWRHPRIGIGCLTVDEAIVVPGALIAPADCVGSANQRFLIEPVEPKEPGVFRLRPVHSGLCVGIQGGPAETSLQAEAQQATCAGTADQRFLLKPVP